MPNRRYNTATCKFYPGTLSKGKSLTFTSLSCGMIPVFLGTRCQANIINPKVMLNDYCYVKES